VTPTEPADTPRRHGHGAADVGETLRRARLHRGWSLRDVERRIGRPNAYLSQIERGVIRQPDPMVVWQLAELYDLNFNLLMEWSGLGHEAADDPINDVTTSALIRQIMNLTAAQRTRALDMLQSLARDEDDSSRPCLA
jgi:transcriptional regulator with XRE-family HTH domain